MVSLHMYKLLLVRHGESEWNRENRFTGWTDVDLSTKGKDEAKRAALLLRQLGYGPDQVLTSVLKRAIRTAWIMLDDLDLMWIPLKCDWRLNERHYGALQGLDKAETAARYGEDKVRLWRRSYDVRPPALSETDPRYPGKDPRYRDLIPSQLPLTESLNDTVARLLPCCQETIAPAVRSSRHVLVLAHGNSLRALRMILEGIPAPRHCGC